MNFYAEFKDNPVLIAMSDEWAARYHSLEFALSAESSLYGLLESQSEFFAQRHDGRLIASDIELAPETGISLEFPGGMFRFVPHWWVKAWESLELEKRAYAGKEVTLSLVLALMNFVPQKKQGQRGKGRTDAEAINSLVNLVNGCLRLSEQDGDPLSIRTAVAMVIETVKEGSEGFKYPVLLPDDGVIPWPKSWGGDPEKSYEKLRVKVQRDIPLGY